MTGWRALIGHLGLGLGDLEHLGGAQTHRVLHRHLLPQLPLQRLLVVVAASLLAIAKPNRLFPSETCLKLI